MSTESIELTISAIADQNRALLRGFEIASTIELVNKISVVINAQNAEKDIARAIASVKSFADEIVVINQDSIDKTSEIAEKLGAKVFNHKSVTYVELARNFAISKAAGNWILVLDPDEEIPASLAKKIVEIIKRPKADYYRIPRKNIIFGKWMKHSRWWPDYNIRLFKKGAVSWNEIIHSVPMTQGTGGELEAAEKFTIVHHHYDSIEKYSEHLNRYTSAQSELKVKEGYSFDWRDLIIKPANEFLSRYFMGEGYKDGLHGLALSLLQGFSELVLYLKVWQTEKFKEEDLKLGDVIREIKNKEKDLHYWQSDVMHKETGSLGERIKRKLRI